MKHIVFALILLFINGNSFADKEVGNGGHPCAGMIGGHAQTILKAIKDIPFFSDKIDMTALSLKINESPIYIKKDTIDSEDWTRHGENCYHKNKVVFWEGVCALGYTYTHKLMILILHEFIGLVDVNADKNFQISNFLHDKTGINAIMFSRGISSQFSILFRDHMYLNSSTNEETVISDNKLGLSKSNNSVTSISISCNQSERGDLFVNEIYYNEHEKIIAKNSKGPFLFESSEMCGLYKHKLDYLNFNKSSWIELIIDLESKSVKSVVVN